MSCSVEDSAAVVAVIAAVVAVIAAVVAASASAAPASHPVLFRHVPPPLPSEAKIAASVEDRLTTEETIEPTPIPTASEYRIKEADIDHTLCVGRSLDGGADKRWKPFVYRESQCGGTLIDGSDLCSKCSKRQEKFAETGKQHPWDGRVTEAPLPDCHMLGTFWATKRNPMFDCSTERAGTL